MSKASPIENTQFFNEVYADLVWFCKTTNNCPSLNFNQHHPEIPADVLGRNFIFEARTGFNKTMNKACLGILIYEIKKGNEDGELFCTMSRMSDNSGDTLATFTGANVEPASLAVMLSSLQISIRDFKESLKNPRTLN